MKERAKEWHRRFSKYQLGAIQYYECGDEDKSQRSLLNLVVAFSSQINILAL